MKIPKNSVPVLMEKPVDFISFKDVAACSDIGIIDEDGRKAFIVWAGKYGFLIVSGYNGSKWCNSIWNPIKEIDNTNVQEVLKNLPFRSKAFVFGDRTALYAWLAQED